MNRITIALAVAEPIKLTSTKHDDVLTLRIDPVGDNNLVGNLVDIPISTESMESLDPLLDAIAEGEYLSLELVKYQ